MKKSEKIAISLPSDVLKAVNAQCKGTGESRSAFFRRAAGELLRRQKEQEAIKRYIKGYQKYPETAEEMEPISKLGLKMLARESWE
jgi:metal-responsive CopG/Arc/MetJ family transcriptional regulator